MEPTSKYWLLPNASSHEYGIQGDNLIYWIHIFMLVLFIGWGIFFIYCLWKFRARPGHKADYLPIKATWSKYLEVAVVVIEGFLLIGISVPFWNEFKENFPAKSEAVAVKVIGMQFKWYFHYPGPDGVYADWNQRAFNPADGQCGISDNDEKGHDDICAEFMNLPKDVPVIADIVSLDVIHGFGIPQLRVKQDAIPGSSIPVWFVPSEIGTYALACSQLCGQGHYSMKADVNVMSQEDYDAWVAKEVADRREWLGLDEEGADDVVDGAAPTPTPKAEVHDGHEGHEGHDEGSHE